MNVKNSLLNELVRNEGEYISGAALSGRLGVSRNAVWKAVKALEGDGYVIESAAKGYRLVSWGSKLAAELISRRFSPEHPANDLVIMDVTDSTNNEAKKLAAKGAAHGTAVIADKQTGGKGRLGRKFESPSGMGLYVSVIIRPKFDISYAPLITSAAAVAAAEAVEQLSGSDVRVKWVNDLYMNGRKICGILTEASLNLEMNMLDYAVIGIGINVRHYDFGEELSRRATSIEAETGKVIDRCELCALLLERLEHHIAGIPDKAHLPEYRRRELLTGNMITASVGNETIAGRAVDIDDNANLIIELDDGTRRTLASGEANLCRAVK